MAIKPATVRGEVERICSSPGFQNAERLKELLRYTVEKSLAAGASELKEYSIGVDVFGRGESFDPKTDSLVRVTAGKLRLKLKEYYAANPSSQIRIEYPSGSYAPRFVELPVNRRWMPWAAGAAGAAALLVLVGAVGVIPSLRKTAQQTLRKVTVDAAIARDAAISRDGKLVAYVSNREAEAFQLYVQQLDGGPPLKLPGIVGNPSSPDFSPDGTSLVFVQRPAKRSSGGGSEPGGVYLTSTLGGTPVRIADGNANPHFSPDGQSIVYGKKLNRIYLVSRKGGPPKQISPDHFDAATNPVFTPDGKHILFLGRPTGIDDQGRDWWVVSLENGKLVQTGAKEVVRAAEKLPDSPFYCHPSGWLAGKVLFSCDFRERSNLFAAPIHPATWKVTGPIERITFGAGAHEQGPSASDSGRIVFTSSLTSTDLHAVSTDPKTDDLSQRDTRQITSHGAPLNHVTVSSDGERMSYSLSALRREIWTRNLRNGHASMLTSGRVFRSVISPDGKQVAYHQPRDNGSRIVVAPFEGGIPRTVCEDCQLVQGWTPDGRRILWGYGNYHGLFAADAETGAQETWIDRKRSVQAGGFSPDGKWLSLSTLGFTSASPSGYVVPIENGRPGAESSWVFVRKGSEQMQWSPDGSGLYYLSDQDGRLCLYGQRLDPVTRHPQGDPFAVYHLHSPERTLFGTWMTPFNFAVTRTGVYFTIVRQQSNIWMLH